MKWQTVSVSVADTEQLGELLGRQIDTSEVIELRSDLGGGKTTFVRGLARGLDSSDAVSSPSFTLMNKYRGYIPVSSHLDAVQGSDEERTSRIKAYGERAPQEADTVMRQEPAGAAGSAGRQGKAVREIWIHHFDFYRLDEPGILADQLAESLADEAVITVIEWSDIVQDVLPQQRMAIEFRPVATNTEERQIIFTYPETKMAIINKLESERTRIRP